MTQKAWILEGVAVGDGDEVVNSIADRIISIQTASGDVSDIKTETDKIDLAATTGLAGISNSLAYRVHEIERHFHGRERWFGKKAVQTATDWADNVIATPYQAISGNNAYGTDPGDEALVLGTADTPAIAGMVKFDLHRLLFTDSNSTSPWKVMLLYGTGTMAAAEAAGQYSTFMVRIDAAASQLPEVPCDVMMPRGAAGATQVWVKAWNATDNATISFFVGLHEYEG